jgi:hypothetical protein
VNRRTVYIGLLAVALALLACVQARPAFDRPVHWTPDGLYYQARLLEMRGADKGTALKETFGAPLSAPLRARDPEHTGNGRWVAYNEPFYDRRIAVPIAGAALYPLAGDQTLLYLSLVGYVASIVALFGLLCLRFRVAAATVVTLATIVLPPLTQHSAYPLTDTWGLTLEITALALALVVFDRGLRWLPLWVAAVLLLGFTRDTGWIPVLATGWCALRFRTRPALALFASGCAAAVPALLLFKAPVRQLFALAVSPQSPWEHTSWSYIAAHYPHALVEYLRDDAGFLRRGQWYTTLYFVGGLAYFLFVAWRRRAQRDLATNMMLAALAVSIGYVLAAPAFSAFRLELMFVPTAAFGLAFASEWAVPLVAGAFGSFSRPQSVVRPVPTGRGRT